MIKLLLAATILLSAALLVANSPLEDDERSHRVKWQNFKQRHRKNYTNSVKDAKRMANFLKVDAVIEEHNSNPDSTFKLGHNEFSDLHDHEKDSLLGVVLPSDVVRSLNTDQTEMQLDDRAVPASLDLRSTGCVGAVKNQGSCGSCWTFSAIAPLEYSYCKKYGKYVSLSEQELVDCATSAGNGCGGGWPDSAFSWMQSSGGAEPTTVYPYTAKNGKCAFVKSKVTAQVASHGKVSNNVAAIQQALVTYGALSVAYQCAGTFRNYRSGVYSSTSGCNGSINHGMTMVGYGTDSASKMDYWIIRNSWGPGWGNGGYILIQKGVNLCSIEDWVYYVTAK